MKRRYYPPRNHQLVSRMEQLSVGEMARQGAIGVEELIRNKVGKIRHWKLTTLGKKRPKWGFEFTVMTYNILSQTAVDCHAYLYRKCNPHHLCEEYRISRILPEILRSKSDVVCLQEVEQHLYDQRIRKVFDSNGFGSIFKKRTGNKSDGCAILWRRAKFSLLRHQEVEYRTKGCEYLTRDNVGLIAVLRPRHPQGSDTQLHVATTHLVFNPRRGDVKLCQLRLLLAELEKSSFRGVGESGRLYHPTVLCGDFNFEPHSPLYSFVESGRLDVSRMVSGNLSGQHEGKDRGGALDTDKLALDRIGIDESGRFRDHGQSSSRGADTTSRDTPASSRDSCHHHSTLENMMHSAQLHSNGPPISDEENEEEELPSIFYHDFNFVPAYKYHHQRGSKTYPVSSMTGNDCNTVDHIFYGVLQKSSASYVEDRLKLLGVYTLPFAEDLKDLEGLPNAHLGSDHLSLMSKFIISFKQ